MIGYYIHHHGNGHLARASVVAAEVAALDGEAVVALSSLPEPGNHPFAQWVTLEPDDHIDDALDADAGGALHWAPLNSAGYAARVLRLTSWAGRHRPRLVVVDVSVEVAVALRAGGTPVVVTAMPGERADDAHTLGYRLASAIIAPWARELYLPSYLEAFANKTSFVGAFSRFDGVAPSRPAEAGRVLVLFGSGGGGPSRAVLDSVAARTGRTLAGFGGAGLPWTADVWDELCRAEVVLTHGGMNALAEVAASARATVVLPQERPFGEQRATATALHEAGIVTTLDEWPTSVEAWPQVLDAATARGGADWKRWNDGSGATRFAQALARVGRR